MFYLISPDEQNRICDIEPQPFEVAAPLFWIEADEMPANHTAAYQDGQIVFEQIIIQTPSHVMQSKPGRDVVFCIGYGEPNKGFINPNLPTGSYNQCSLLIAGSGYARNTSTDQQIVLDKVGHLYDLSSFKGSAISYNSYDNGTEWVAVNPINDVNINVSVMSGPGNYNISQSHSGITVFNAKGTASVNNQPVELNHPVFYHSGTELDIQIDTDSYVILVRYTDKYLPEASIL